MLPVIHIEAWAVIAQEWLFTAIAGVMVLLRLYVRIKRHMFSASDAVVVLAMISLIFASICDTLLVAYGLHDQSLEITPEGPHSVYTIIPRDRLVMMFKILWGSSFPYYSTLWLVKVALILLFYNHLTADIIAPRLKLYLHLTTAIVLLTYLLCIPLNVFGCMPISSNWEVDDPKKACIEYWNLKIYYTTACCHVLTDVLLFSIPFFLLPHLRLPRRTRHAIMAMFAFGFFGVAVTVSRIVYVITTDGNPVIGVGQSWACLEQAVGVIVCCLPAIWTLRLGLRGDKLDVERLYVSREVMEQSLRMNRKDVAQDQIEEAAQEKWWWELRAQRTKDSG